MQRQVPLLTRYLNLPNLSPFLIARNLITFEESIKLRKQWEESHWQDTVVELLAVLQRKCPQWEDGLLEALAESVEQPNCHMGHRYILDEIGKQPILCYHCGNVPRSVYITSANLQHQVGSHLHYPNHRYHPDCSCSRLLEKIDELVRENVTLKQQNKALELAQRAPIGANKPEGIPEPSLSTEVAQNAVENELYTQQDAGDLENSCAEAKNLTAIAEEVVDRAIKAASQKQLKSSDSV